jgi:flagellar M-ring protein FliF
MSDTSLVHALLNAKGSRRFIVLGLAAAAIVAIVLVGNWASTPTYVPILSNLDLKEAGQIADNLTKAGIKFRLGGGGSSVEVPVADAARARVALAKAGLPADGRPGLELFDKPTWGMTDFTQRVTFQRALEGELARTIGAIQGVERAQVHLVVPTPSPLRRLERPATASVVLSLKPGLALAPDAVQGITYIVSNSVEQLGPENVAVMDDAGHLLSTPANASGTGMTTRQLDIQHALEGHLSDKIENLLGTVVGTGRARAQVAADMSFDQVDRTVEVYDPEKQVLQTEQRSESQGGSADGGPQTVVSNEYQNSRSVERATSAVGSVRKLTVAVLVDTKAIRASTGVTTDRLEQMVRDAIGADSTRGDRVSVLSVPFEAVVATDVRAGGAMPAAPALDPIRVAGDVGRPVAGVIAIVAVVLIALKAMGPAGPRRPRGVPVEEEEPVVTAPIRPIVPTGVQAEILEMRKRLQAETEVRPETAAQVLRAWLAES